ncbi:hypothetical protein NM688_g6311 [Phlebia brevispora]|uniref:Uncharacterized protein n=1 Tax=Phlebia brevispora TaxID=194682 RepID=A0ACC1SHI1_9APHY|nr:hypothetical protein NM688_g6311 [Phlebia brevispora]
MLSCSIGQAFISNHIAENSPGLYELILFKLKPHICHIMNQPRYTPLEPPTTVTPSLTMVQQAFSRVQQRLSPSRQVQPALSTVQEASETSSITSAGDRMSGYGTDDTAVGGSHRYQQVQDEDYDEDDPFADVRRSALLDDDSGLPGSRVLRYANETLDDPTDSRPASAEPVQRPQSSWSEVSSSEDADPPTTAYVAPPHTNRLNPATYTTPTRPIDHFRYDTEAYATGTYRTPTQNPRSRSPTPAMDDEDYRILDNGNVQYVGYAGYSGGYAAYSEEKDALQRDIGSLPYNGPWRPPDAQSEKTDGSESTCTNSRFSQKSGYKEPQSPVTTRHFGPAPIGRMQRRLGYKKRIPLTNGHLTVDLDVPDRLKAVLPNTSAGKGTDETVKLRYTAVTGDPDNFPKSYWLRQNQYQRTTELFIVITMYNVVVCIVADGRKKVHPRVLDVLTLLGVYQAGDHMKSMVNNQPISAHLFEYTTTFGLDQDLHFRYPDKGVMPTQILFCMKEKNAKKINSHRWFFNAFGPCLQPNVCVLLDVGTMPGPKSIYHLWKTFDLNSNVGGACGEIAAYKGKHWRSLLNPLVAAQNFEYKTTNILDKPTESLFGYISVLPGAFSAYRYIALQNDERGVGPLASYFKGEVLHGRDTDIFTSNMYLAEDRILCFELVAKANSSWLLRYVKSAIGETDVPDALPEFISQRRRWLNGSFFAATYAIAHTGQIWRSGHTTGRKLVLMAETVYNVVNLVASWFALGNFYLFFVILTSSLESEIHVKFIKYLNAFIQYVMAGLVIAAFLLSMGNKPKASKWKYKILTIVFAVFMVYMIFCAVMATLQAVSIGGGANRIMIFSLLATYGGE